jgi:dipeptidyl aminopeptidase/acylaminoacyl peptidase
VNEDRLRTLLRETPVPGAEEAGRRGLAMTERAFAERSPQRRPALPRLAVAFAAATLLAALLLTPAGASVREWIGDAFTAGVRDAEPALTEVPGGGQLLVNSTEGPWVVQPDGSRRLLGSYEEATWSPHGLFVGAASGHTLSAVEPGGTVRWSLSAKAPVSSPRWSPSGVRIAYRAGNALRVVVGDGTGDALLATGTAPVPPVWSPQGQHLLAYVDARRRLRIVNTDMGAVLTSTAAQPGNVALDWSGDGSLLLEAAPGSLLLRELITSKLTGFDFGQARRIPLPPGATIKSASFSPSGKTIAALLDLSGQGKRRQRSEVVLIGVGNGSGRTLFTAPGRLSDLAWSPDGSRLLIGWPDADQWLFIPANGSRRARAVAGISAEFAPGESSSASFPRIDGWCCPASIHPTSR